MSATTTATTSSATTTTAKLPPFPSNVATAPIATVSLKKLLASDGKEASRVLEACRTYGFFYLDLRDDSSGQALLDQSEQLLTLAKDVFDLPLEEKTKYTLVRGQSLMGYKPAGNIKKSDPDQRPDTTEFMSVSKDHMHDIRPSRTYPAPIEQAKPLIKSFTKGSHECGMVIMKILAQQLGLHPDAFTNTNAFDRASEDNMRVTKKTPHDEKSNSIGLVSHTDFGTITILFNWLGGLQIQSRDPAKEGEWELVKPMPGHAIINLGDAAVKWTNGMLKSAKHRVVNAPGEQAKVDRYSVVYFVRPNNDALMKKMDGIDSTGLEQVDHIHIFAGEEDGKVYDAFEWNRQRQIQLGN